MPALFEKTKNYTELLLSLSVIDQDGVVYHLIHDIPEDDFNIERGGQVEIIGWLYQYYNTEPKAAAFAKNCKITKEEIPAVTQLFTPERKLEILSGRSTAGAGGAGKTGRNS